MGVQQLRYCQAAKGMRRYFVNFIVLAVRVQSVNPLHSASHLQLHFFRRCLAWPSSWAFIHDLPLPSSRWDLRPLFCGPRFLSRFAFFRCPTCTQEKLYSLLSPGTRTLAIFSTTWQRLPRMLPLSSRMYPVQPTHLPQNTRVYEDPLTRHDLASSSPSTLLAGKMAGTETPILPGGNSSDTCMLKNERRRRRPSARWSCAAIHARTTAPCDSRDRVWHRSNRGVSSSLAKRLPLDHSAACISGDYLSCGGSLCTAFPCLYQGRPLRSSSVGNLDRMHTLGVEGLYLSPSVHLHADKAFTDFVSRRCTCFITHGLLPRMYGGQGAST
ncbi:unnamed protein product [Scytosiphon promiscuus]